MIVRVNELSGGINAGLVMAKGHFEGRVLRLLLPTAGVEKTTTDSLAQGALLALKAPTWDVEISGEIWTVGVDWSVARA